MHFDQQYKDNFYGAVHKREVRIKHWLMLEREYEAAHDDFWFGVNYTGRSGLPVAQFSIFTTLIIVLIYI
jgi:hypothetical protein